MAKTKLAELPVVWTYQREKTALPHVMISTSLISADQVFEVVRWCRDRLGMRWLPDSTVPYSTWTGDASNTLELRFMHARDAVLLKLRFGACE